MIEEIIEAIETNDRKMLYFTSNRVIVASIGGRVLSATFGLLGALAEAQMRAKKKEQLQKLTPESILTADKSNFALPYNEVGTIEISKKMLGRKVRIISGTQKHEFWMAKPKEYEEYVNILRPVLGDKLVVS